MYIVIAILVFSFLIFIHELGHFITAKLSGVQVNEFAMFMGPKIFSKTIGETTYRLNCLPIGGYCAMEGEDGESDNPRAFSNAAVWKRVIILCAGAFMNFLAGFLIMVILIGMSYGIRNSVVTDIEPQSDLVTIGVQAGDEFYSIDGHRVFIASDMALLLNRNTTGVFDLTVVRNGEKIDFNQVKLTKKVFEEGGAPLFGFGYNQIEKVGVGNTIREAWNSCRYFTRLVWFSLGDLISGAVAVGEVSGPVGVVKQISAVGEEAENTSDGIFNVMYLFAFIAVNLAVMNMLPIPALDGGHVVTLLLTWGVEKIIRKKLNPKIEGYIHAVGLILLLGLMLVITLHDVVGLFQ